MQLLTSVRKALEVLKALGEEGPELSLARISERTGLHKSSAFRILATLEASGFVEKDRASGRYRLGLELLELAGQVAGRFRLRDLAGPFMEELAREIGEIVHLAVLDGADVVYLEKKGQGRGLTVATRIGGRNPAYSSALGKALLAGLPGEELERTLGGGPFERWTPHTITERPALQEELERVRRRGWALDDEETFPGIRCVAAPVRDGAGRVIAALSATVPKQRLDAGRMRDLRRRVVETARAVTDRVAGTAAAGGELER